MFNGESTLPTVPPVSVSVPMTLIRTKRGIPLMPTYSPLPPPVGSRPPRMSVSSDTGNLISLTKNLFLWWNRFGSMTTSPSIHTLLLLLRTSSHLLSPRRPQTKYTFFVQVPIRMLLAPSSTHTLPAIVPHPLQRAPPSPLSLSLLPQSRNP
ncbi:hypothetical protein K503DRAFT_805592 [Rhizopogon vinicolor AM-OR11-026]|uniref:Uncharacterized protein n=1 Tax=Rhizopogon vinicolor AM-OR11-026 TaxID=1314800 RepID=A0A1B7MHD6_9AGAM|nr:hypothetical protein K503DRAFT_805592 [Rhizopogon vinicolor AM-OR11-026]